jgi:hypothetical protein
MHRRVHHDGQLLAVAAELQDVLADNVEPLVDLERRRGRLVGLRIVQER